MATKVATPVQMSLHRHGTSRRDDRAKADTPSTCTGSSIRHLLTFRLPSSCFGPPRPRRAMVTWGLGSATPGRKHFLMDALLPKGQVEEGRVPLRDHRRAASIGGSD